MGDDLPRLIDNTRILGPQAPNLGSRLLCSWWSLSVNNWKDPSEVLPAVRPLPRRVSWRHPKDILCAFSESNKPPFQSSWITSVASLPRCNRSNQH